MKNHHKILAFALFCFLITNGLFSQSDKKPISKRTQDLKVEALDEIQQDQLTDLKHLYQQKQDRILKSSQSGEELASSLQDLRNQYMLQVSKILSKDQYQKWKAMQPLEQNLLLTNSNH